MRIRLSFVVVFATLLIGPSLLFAQEKGTSSDATSVEKPSDNSSQIVHAPAPVPRHFYRLDFVLRETESSKLINQRAFTMNVSADPTDSRSTWWNLRAGTRVPIREPNGTNYVDAGVNIDLCAKDAENALQLEITADISSLPAEPGGTMPAAIRQIKVKGAVFAPLGKQTMVFTTEDPGSGHQFELQVTPVRTH